MCDVLAVEHPILQGPLGGPWPPSIALAAAVSQAGGVGSLATVLRSPAEVRKDADRLRAVTDRPFAINHTMRPFDDDVFQAMLDVAPPVVSFALGFSADLVARVHDVGATFVQQVHTVRQARIAADGGVDVIIAQGDEAGGFGGGPGTFVLVPQVVDAVQPVPVVAAGGIADGRGLAAALTLGAVGVNVGTRFLASDETEVDEDWKGRILEAESEETARASFVTHLVPAGSPGSFDVSPRVIRSEFIERWLNRDDKVVRDRERLREEVTAAIASGRGHELIPIAGAAAGLVHEVLPAADIVLSMVADAEAALAAVVTPAE